MRTTNIIEFGDFQTPLTLAREIAAFLKNMGEHPDVIVEPTCGRGSFVTAVAETFPNVKALYGFDINPAYVTEAAGNVPCRLGSLTKLECRDFFQTDWAEFLSALSGTVLIIGNPPWVTNSALGALGSSNLPEKTNFQRHNGFSAKTGKANFDISEWMLIRLVEALHSRTGCIAVLCKTSTARKTLRYAWVNNLKIGRCSLHHIDAQQHFGASVDACLLLLHTGKEETVAKACVYAGLSFDTKLSTLGFIEGQLVADIEEFLRLRDIDGIPYYTWRSGVKHDAATVMEFRRTGEHYTNGNQTECRLESTYLFPLLKSSDIANGRTQPKRYVLLTQRSPADDTSAIQKSAPQTWAYLSEHAEALDQRRSIIYAKRARFSIFGVGDYTFSPWKVAISGLYKTCHFEVVATHQGKPIVLDDTCYFIPCASEEEARFICGLLNSEVCQKFIHSLVFLDSKRPITIDTLNRIDLKRVAEHLNVSDEAQRFLARAAGFEDRQQLLVFEKRNPYQTSGPSDLKHVKTRTRTSKSTEIKRKKLR